jgi:hypothetical protein
MVDPNWRRHLDGEEADRQRRDSSATTVAHLPRLEFLCSRERPRRVSWSLTDLLRRPFRLQHHQPAGMRIDG